MSERIEALRALATKDAAKFSDEHVSVLQGLTGLEDDEIVELTSSEIDAVNAFIDDPDGFLSDVSDEDFRGRLEAIRRQTTFTPDQHSAPAVDPAPAASSKTPVGTARTSAPNTTPKVPKGMASTVPKRSGSSAEPSAAPAGHTPVRPAKVSREDAEASERKRRFDLCLAALRVSYPEFTGELLENPDWVAIRNRIVGLVRRQDLGELFTLKRALAGGSGDGVPSDSTVRAAALRLAKAYIAGVDRDTRWGNQQPRAFAALIGLPITPG